MQSFNNRILIPYFSGNPATTIFIQYAPGEGSPDAENHYHNLSSVINDSPKHNVLIVLGDFNAHIGNKDVKYTYHKDTNSNEQYLLDLQSLPKLLRQSGKNCICSIENCSNARLAENNIDKGFKFFLALEAINAFVTTGFGEDYSCRKKSSNH